MHANLTRRTRPQKSRQPLRYLLASLLLAGAAAEAQSDAAVAGDATIDEIVVSGSYTTRDKLDSATGLGLSISETPQSVSVMTFQRMLDQDLQSLTDVVHNAAGVSAKAADSSRDFYSARGFAIDNYQIDGVPMEWSSGGDAGETQSDTTLYERVEIVRGATGLLTGAGNPSASINLVRKHADSKVFTGFTSLGMSRWNTWNAMVDLSAPITNEGAVRGRVVLNYEDGDSWLDLAGNTKSVAYGVVDADLGDSTLLRAGLSYQDNDPTASTWGGLPSWYSDGSRTDWPRSKTIAADWTRWASTNENHFVNLSHEFGNGWQARFDYNRSKNDAELYLLYLYGAPDRDTGLGLGASPYRSDTSREQESLNFRLGGSFGWLGREHEATFGYAGIKQNFITLYYPNDSIPPVGDFNAWDGSYPEPGWGAASTDIDIDTDQTGFYAATRLSLTDSLKTVLGARLATWDESGDQYGTPLDYGDSNVLIPYAGMLYDINDRHTVYASYTEIFRPQNNQDRNGDFLDPLTGKSYEIGLKSGFLDDSLQTSVALFRIDQDNLPQPDTGHLIPGTIFEASRAAQGTRSEGYELEVVGRLSPGWDVSFSYTNFTADDADGVDVSTDQPRKMAKLFTTYRFGDLTVGGGVNWQGPNYTTTINPVTTEPTRLSQDSYALASLMFRYDVSERLSAQLNVDNLFDETYYSQIGFYDQLAYGEPQNASLHVRYRFR